MLVALVVALLAVGILFHVIRAERDALIRMPETNRRVLYEQTLRSTQSLCERARTDEALLDRCEDSARFLLSFPECDETCRTFAAAHRRGPAR